MEGVMPTLNATARNTMATAAGSLCGTGTLQILAGGTVLATHTMAGFGSPSTGVVVGSAIADATNAATGTATSARITNGSNQIDLTIGTSASEVIVPSLSYVAGGTSTINSVTLTYPAS
jgi:hypothetical protein